MKPSRQMPRLSMQVTYPRMNLSKSNISWGIQSVVVSNIYIVNMFTHFVEK